MQKVRRGFTMIEISLSMAFISVLSITIVLLISNTVTTYHRGMVLNQINTVGMAIVDDMRGAIQSAPADSLTGECAALYPGAGSSAEAKCEEDRGMSFVVAKRYADVKGVGNVPVYGAFCTGEYSYLWNSGYLLNTSEYEVLGISGGIRAKYKIAGDDAVVETSGTARLVKIADEDRMVCKKAAGYISEEESNAAGGGSYRPSTNYSGLGNLIDITSKPIEEAPEDVLEENGNMVLYDLTSSMPARNDFSNGAYTAVSFILGTLQGGIDIKASSDYCKVPTDYESGLENFDYCAINKFNFAARSMGR